MMAWPSLSKWENSLIAASSEEKCRYHSRMRWILVFLLVAIPAAAAELPDLGDPARAVLSEDAEMKVGREIMQEIRSSHEYLDDPILISYLNRLGERLVAASDEPNRRFSFFVIRDTTLNAFALPGGFIGVHTGLISAVRSESELAGVLAHEIAHVTQHHIARMVKASSEQGPAMLAALAVAILASRTNPDAANAAIVGSQALSMQSQIDYTRLHEREADRVGFQTLERSGFDPSGMASFFERLQAQGRLYENNAPTYLRTHPLSHERMADLQDRVTKLPYHQVPNSLEFSLIRARIQAQEGKPWEARQHFEAALKNRPHDPGALYGLIEAALRDASPRGLEQAIARLRAAAPLALTEILAARVAEANQGVQAAIPILQAALIRWPGDKVLGYELAGALLRHHESAAARALILERQRTWLDDSQLFRLLAEAEAQLGHVLESHLAQAEAYQRQGLLSAAIEQLQIGLRTGKADFYTQSIAEARLQLWREQLRQQREQDKPRR